MEQIDNLLLEDYIQTIQRIYENYRRFTVISRIYSGTIKLMMIMNVGSLFYSIIYPEQHYSLILSLVSFSLSSMFDVNSRYDTLNKLVSLYSNHIIPDIERYIYEHIGKNIRSMKDYTNEIPPSTDYLEKKREVEDLVSYNYRRFMGEDFTVPMSLRYVNFWGISVCIILYISIFIVVPLLLEKKI